MSGRRDFWLACGHHLLDKDEHGRLRVTDEFLKAYLARPEVVPPDEACPAELALHQALLSNPRQTVEPGRVAAIIDAEARENWSLMIAWRDHLTAYASLESAYLAIVRLRLKFPRIFLDQLVQVILRNILDDCDDAFMLRAAELLFRSQKLIPLEGSLLASDEEVVSRSKTAPVSPLNSLLGIVAEAQVDVLSEQNTDVYWERSDAFDMSLDLTAGRRGLVALGLVVTRWVQHLLGIDVKIDPAAELRDENLVWYVCLDADATRIGDQLWHGEKLCEADRRLVVGLYRMRFAPDAGVIEQVQEAPTHMIVAMSADHTLRLKPQNLITGLPIRHRPEALN